MQNTDYRNKIPCLLVFFFSSASLQTLLIIGDSVLFLERAMLYIDKLELNGT